jgi:hypothetical protein
MSARVSAPRALLLSIFAISTLVRAQDDPRSRPGPALGTSQILGHSPTAFRIDSITTRITAFDQSGSGYQSQAGPLLGPGSERTTILEPQVEIVASQGDRIKHRVWIPLDIVTAASPDAVDLRRNKVDAVSSASRQNTAGTLDWAATYRISDDSEATVDAGLHLEEPFRSWHGGMSGTHEFGDGALSVSAGLLEVFDWFDHFDIQGFRSGRINRSSTTGSVGATQILTPTTLVGVNYGLTIQKGELGNTWNTVPLTTVKLGPELLPTERARHSIVGRASQFLPWNGALHLYYRFYTDDWGIRASSVEGDLMQRLTSTLYVGALYRFHTQTGARFFTTRAAPSLPLRTSDSDLAPLEAHSFGGKVVLDVPGPSDIRTLHFDLAFERYTRTNDLQVNVVTWGTGYKF